jgi:murein DD-endopeptidase MepM/ murein hydrolase activator NlpD
LKNFFNDEIKKKELISVMQKDDRYYTILFTRSFYSKFFNQPVKVSKKSLHTCAAAAFLLAIITTGIFGFTKFDVSYFAKVNAQTQPATSSQPIKFARTNSTAEVKAYNYDRPDSANISKDRIGGPEDGFQLSTGEPDAGENNTEALLRTIETTSNPEFLPSMWAHLGKVNNEFGYRRNPFGGRSYEFHSGMDIDGENGDGVIAPAKGMVVKAGWQGGYGNLIEIDHGNGLITRYGHLSRIGAQVGDMIERGQLIGLIGSTGRSTGPHLHYEIRLGDKAINPRRFLPPSMPN